MTPNEPKWTLMNPCTLWYDIIVKKYIKATAYECGGFFYSS
jgi:hypothetical protein